LASDGLHPFGSKKSRRCYHRVMSGLERGGSLRFITLTSSPDAPADIQRSWRALYMRMVRRGLITGYIKVPEFTKAGRLHLHILYRGSYISQRLLSSWWKDIHRSEVVDIRMWRPYRGKKATANYMAKYMAKETAGRYSWSWGWVWRGFCKHWKYWKRYWWENLHVEGKNTFSNCLVGWKMWLRGVIRIDVSAMISGLPPPFVITFAIGVENVERKQERLFCT